MSLKLPIIVPLSKPILDGAEPISELRFTREPTVGDLEKSEAATGDTGRVILLTAALLNLTPREVRAISARDMPQLGEALEALMGGEEAEMVPPTGET